MSKVKAKLITVEDDIPTLKFRENAHLSWFRGYRFQVSGTAEGIGNYGSSSSTLQHDLSIASNYGLKGSESGKFRQLITLSHIFEATAEYPDFWEMTYEDPTLLNQFVQQTDSVDSGLYGEDFDFNELLSLVTISSSVPFKDKHKIHFLAISPNKKEEVGAAVYLDQDIIALYDVDSTVWYSFNLKDLFETVFEKSDIKAIFIRLLFVLQCKAELNLGWEIRNITGEPVTGIDKEDRYVVHPDRIYSLIQRGDFFPIESSIKGSNLFG